MFIRSGQGAEICIGLFSAMGRVLSCVRAMRIEEDGGRIAMTDGSTIDDAERIEH